MAASSPWPVEVRATILTVVVLMLVAAPIGLLWAHLTPNTALIGLPTGDATVGRTEGVIRADMLFALVTGAAGIVTGVVAWFAARRSGPGSVIGLAGGGLAAALVARTVGRRVIDRHVRSVLLTKFQVRPSSHLHVMAPPLTEAVVLAWALTAVLTFLVLVATRDFRRPRAG